MSASSPAAAPARLRGPRALRRVAAPSRPERTALLTPPVLRECAHCGLLQHIPGLPRAGAARCPRCHSMLRRQRPDPLGWPLALALTGIALMVVVALLPFMDLTLLGNERSTNLVTGPTQLEQSGLAPVAILVLATTLLAPLGRLLGLVWVLLHLRLGRTPRYLAGVFRWVERLRPWSMVEVFLLGVFVAYTKLVDLAHVDVGAACYAMGALMMVVVAGDATLDVEAVWEALPVQGPRVAPLPGAPGPRPVGCPHCGLVSAAATPRCPRCDGLLAPRKPHSLSRTWCYLIAAAALYLPANILPVLTLTRLGQGEPSTIIGGALQLLQAGMWPLALLVFFASITVPLLKIASLVTMLITTRTGTAWWLRGRTHLYRLVDFIGRWSMIDVFMISILTALVHFGYIAQVYPGLGVLAFASVVVLTMLAAMSFDPRLMWDAAARRHPDAVPTVRPKAGQAPR